jgi:ABC-type glycerol-3-phosphate transport system substrate-binding protein
MEKFVVILSLVLTLCICSVSFAQEPETLTLLLRGGTYAEVVKALIPEFEAAHNCKIEYSEETFDDLHMKISMYAINAEGTYDVVVVDGSWKAEFLDNEILADLTELGYAYDEDIIPATLPAGIDGEGHAFLIPFYGNVTVFMYNQDLIEKYNNGVVPTNWADVLTLAQTMKADGVDGFLLRAGAGDNNVSDFLPVLKSFGAWVMNDDYSEITINTPEAKEALRMYIDLYKAGNMLDKDNIVAAINSGSAAMGVGWPGWGADHYTTIPTMAFEGAHPQNSSIYGCWFIGMAANSTHKDLALEFLKEVTSAEYQQETVEIGGVPCRESCLLAPESLLINPNLEVVFGSLSVGTYRPFVTFWSEYYTILGPYLEAAVMGQMSVDDALDTAQAELEDLL